MDDRQKESFEKLIIQIPCFNEEETLPDVLRSLPRAIPGVKKVEWMVVDDGSRDRTSEVARQFNVDHLIRYKQHRGLAQTFQSGVAQALKQGADIIVNLDGDNQYVAADIPTLIAPILNQEADMVVGARDIWRMSHFSWLKKMFQSIGSAAVRLSLRVNVADAASGFRAYSRHAALRLNAYTHYSHTLETLVHAKHNGVLVTSVPVRVNPPLRQSRLARNMFSYIFNSVLTLARLFLLYYSALLFWLVAAACGVATVHYFGVRDASNGRFFAVLAALFFSLGVIADHLYVIRRLLQSIKLMLRIGR